MASQLYFAYGSNLSLKQMASRCPDSIFVGRGILPDHCWQINERGFANVIPRSGFNVHGLVYEISIDDEIRLDRHEGVANGSYSKENLPVIVYPAVPDLRLLTRHLVGEGFARALERSKFSASPRTMYLQGKVLVYASKIFVSDNLPREEYINRMNAGIWDARRLGVPADYFESFLRPKIPDRPILRPSVRSVNRRTPMISPARVSEPLHRGRSVPAERRRRASHGEASFPTSAWIDDDPANRYGGARVVTAFPSFSGPSSPRRWEERQYY